ncbi:DUF4389 domain-containing protein [Kordiimonas sp.]|uniref:DUF4389 domain-containing protein n=1 Tax=Kordiimonas sp. TaxID=1970157 RepID=UPI003A95B4E4
MSEETKQPSPDAGDKKPAAEKAAVKKPVAKKAAPKKTAATSARKTAATKPAAKKPAAKKPAATKTAAAKRATTAKKTSPAKTGATKAASTAAETAATEKASTSTPNAGPAADWADEPPKTDQQSSYAGQTDSQADDQADDPYSAEKLAADFKEKDWKEVFIRAAFTVFYMFAGWIAIALGFAFTLIQFIIHLVTGHPNDVVKKAILCVGQYIRDIAAYVSFDSDERPFPFGKDLPDGD